MVGEINFTDQISGVVLSFTKKEVLVKDVVCVSDTCVEWDLDFRKRLTDNEIMEMEGLSIILDGLKLRSLLI